MMQRIIVAMWGLLFTTLSWGAPETLQSKKIQHIVRYDNSAVLQFSPPESNSQGCTNNYDNQVILEWQSVDNRREMVGMLYAAMLADKEVSLGINGCHANYATVYRVIFFD